MGQNRKIRTGLLGNTIFKQEEEDDNEVLLKKISLLLSMFVYKQQEIKLSLSKQIISSIEASIDSKNE